MPTDPKFDPGHRTPEQLFGPRVPQTYGEAIKLWGIVIVECHPHEWDNRTTEENAAYLLERFEDMMDYLRSRGTRLP